jgi:outer membrane protein TolC
MAPQPTASVPQFAVREDRPERFKPLDMPEGPITVETAVQTAIRFGPRSRRSVQAVWSSLAQLGQAKARFWPQISAELGFTRAKGQSFDDSVDPESYYETSWRPRATMNWTLIDWVRGHSVKAAEAGVRSAMASHNRELLDIGRAAEVAYYRLLEAEALLGVVEETVELRDTYVRQAERLRQAGGRVTDLMKARADLAEAQNARVEARARVQEQRGLLASIMGYPPNTDIQVVAMPEELPVVDLINVQRMLEMAGRERPRLKTIAAEITRLEQQNLAEDGRRLPNLSALASFGWAGPDFPPEGEHTEWTLGMTLSMDLFTGFQRTYRLVQFKHEILGARFAYEAALREVELGVWRAYTELLRARDAIGTSRAFLDSAASSLEQFNREYAAGRLDIVALNDAQATYTRAQFSLVRARLDYYVALAELNRSVGRGLDRAPTELAPFPPPEGAEPPVSTEPVSDEVTRFPEETS